MSYHKILQIPVLPAEVRDYSHIDEGAAAFNIDLWTTLGVVGLDWFCFNDGAAVLTVTIDAEIQVTIPPNGTLGIDNTKFAIIQSMLSSTG
ncbi:unnamed protein product [marine sediment metagenome]|uniref:Uncharacterized protein n=1 Tax=marine sediment metagenome TaxID=412755 RepID=X1N6P7_9ZZZZ